MTEVLSSEDMAYLRACAALNIDPSTGEKISASNGNGLKDAVVKREREKRQHEQANIDAHVVRESAQKRQARNRESNRQGWILYHEHLEKVHRIIADEHTQARADLVRLGDLWNHGASQPRGVGG